MPRLVGTQGTLIGQEFELGPQTVLGRATDCSIEVPDPGVSRHHVRIQVTESGTLVEDLGSGNGTFVNSQRIALPTPLVDQDCVQIGRHEFRYLDDKEQTGVRIADGESSFGAAIEGTLDVGATMVGGVFSPAPAQDASKANEHLRTIVQVGSAIQSEFDIKVLLRIVMDKLFEAFDQADRGFLMLYDESGELEPAAAKARKGGTEEITISRRIVQEVTSKRVALLSRDASSDDRFGAAMSIANFNIRSMMCAPLIAKDELLGIIHVDTMRMDRLFTEDDLQLLTGVASQTALAIATAKMHEQLLVRDRMQRDLKIATQVQSSFLPKSEPEAPGMEFAAWYGSALDIGGDLYDFVPQGETGMAVVVGDVSGKGIPAALMMARMSSDVRYYSAQFSEPKDVLPRLNNRQAESDMPDVFVTMAFVSVDLQSHEILVGNAAHCMPIVRRAAEGDVIEVSAEPGFPLGVVPDFEFEQCAYSLQPGDVVVLVTDGVTEAMDAEHDAYGEERLRRTIADAPPSARAVLEAILEDVKEHVQDTKQSDDLTCVCFGVKATADPTAETERLGPVE